MGVARRDGPRAASQVAVLPAALRVASEKVVLVAALTCSVVEAALLATAPAAGDWLVYTAISIGSVGSMAFAIVTSIKSAHTAPSEQGAVQVRLCTCG